MQHKSAQLSDTSKLKATKKNIARVKTIIKEKTNE
jgi:ribosomal protein L29